MIDDSKYINSIIDITKTYISLKKDIDTMVNDINNNLSNIGDNDPLLKYILKEITGNILYSSTSNCLITYNTLHIIANDNYKTLDIETPEEYIKNTVDSLIKYGIYVDIINNDKDKYKSAYIFKI